MTTRRGEAHQKLVRSERKLKNAFRAHDPLAQRFYLFCAVAAHQQYSAKWKEAKKHAGNGQHSR